MMDSLKTAIVFLFCDFWVNPDTLSNVLHDPILNLYIYFLFFSYLYIFENIYYLNLFLIKKI